MVHRVELAAAKSSVCNADNACAHVPGVRMGITVNMYKPYFGANSSAWGMERECRAWARCAFGLQ